MLEALVAYEPTGNSRVERTHIQTPSAVDYRDHDIHPSGREQMQANSERVRRSEGDGVFHELAGFGS
jgi:hypothetical protein